MSQRDRLTMEPHEVIAFLNEGLRAHVATINPDGTLTSCRCRTWCSTTASPSGPIRSRGKIANLRRDRRITCLVEAGATFPEMRAVQLSGWAELGEDADSSRKVGLALFNGPAVS